MDLHRRNEKGIFGSKSNKHVKGSKLFDKKIKPILLDATISRTHVDFI
jgi:hypothetical protein